MTYKKIKNWMEKTKVQVEFTPDVQWIQADWQNNLLLVNEENFKILKKSQQMEVMVEELAKIVAVFVFNDVKKTNVIREYFEK